MLGSRWKSIARLFYGGALTGLDELLNFDEFDLDNSIEKCTVNTGASPPCNFYKFIHVEV